MIEGINRANASPVVYTPLRPELNPYDVEYNQRHEDAYINFSMENYYHRHIIFEDVVKQRIE